MKDHSASRTSVRVQVPGDGDRTDTRLGADLDAVLRDVLIALRTERGWKSWSEAAARLGVTQQALQKFITGKNGATLTTLSKMCAALQLDPTALFARNPNYSVRREFAADHYFDQFRAVLDRGEAARLLPILRAPRGARRHADGASRGP